MLGRGTRKGEKFPDKSHFTVFDCFDGTLLAYFRNSTGLTADPPEKPARSIKEIIDDIWANHDRDYNIRCLVQAAAADREGNGRRGPADVRRLRHRRGRTSAATPPQLARQLCARFHRLPCACCGTKISRSCW